MIKGYSNTFKLPPLNSQIKNVLRTWIGAVIVSSFSFAWLLRFASKDPDLHHDGFMVGAAIALREGKVLHRDVFQAYGLPITFLQAWIAPPEGPTVLSIRILSIGLSALTAGSLVLIALIKAPLGAMVVSGVTWTLIADFSWTSQAHESVRPMSTVLAVLLLCISYLTISWGVSTADSSFSFSHSLAIIAGGVALGMAVFTRINVALLALLVTIMWILLSSRRHAKVAALVRLFLGFGLGLLPTVLYLATNGALTSYWADAIVFPRTQHIPMIYQNWVLPWLNGRSLIPLAALLVLVIGSIVFARTRTRHAVLHEITKTGARRITATLLVVTIVALVATLYALRASNSPFETLFYQRFVRFAFWVIFGTVCLTSCAALFGISRSMLVGAPKNYLIENPIQSRQLYLAGMSLSCLALIVPWLGPRYAWWGMPLGVALLAWLLSERIGSGKRLALGAAITLAFLSMLTSVASSDLFTKYRVMGLESSVLRGMDMPPEFGRQVNRRFESIDSLNRERYLFVCFDSVYAVAFRRYAISGKYLHVQPDPEARATATDIPIEDAESALAEAITNRSSPVITCGRIGMWESRLQMAGYDQKRIDDGFSIWRESRAGADLT